MSSLKKQLKNIIRDSLRLILTPSVYNKFRFIIVHRYYPSFVNPSTFSEKVFARKLDSESLSFSRYVDKYTVRKYVEDTIGKEHLIPLIAKTTHVTPDFFHKAPNKFVIKTSNGGGGENVKVVLDKSKLTDLNALSAQFNRYLKVKIGQKIDENFYDIETPQVLMEELLMHEDGSLPSDYKLHIFQGDDSNQEKVIIQVDSDRFSNHKRSLYSEHLEKLDFAIQPKYESVDDSYEFPINMPDVVSLAKKLAKPFKYVRVDMYNVDGKVYFGELTFCHGSGWEPFSSKDTDVLLGSYWKEFNK
ncbi:hypothetical protein ABNJ07_002864 [Vibrio parahaemolyticus]